MQLFQILIFANYYYYYVLLAFSFVHRYIGVESRSGKLFLKLFQSFIQLYLTDCVPQICVLRRGISRSPFVLDLVWQLQLSLHCIKSAKELANFWFVSVCSIKRQFCRYSRSGNFKISNSLQYWLIESCRFLNKIFLKALFCSFCMLF